MPLKMYKHMEEKLGNQGVGVIGQTFDFIGSLLYTTANVAYTCFDTLLIKPVVASKDFVCSLFQNTKHVDSVGSQDKSDEVDSSIVLG